MKRRAQIAVQNARDCDRIEAPERCEGCGKKTEALQGHHYDYSLATSVRWFCAKCHGNAHADDRKLAEPFFSSLALALFQQADPIIVRIAPAPAFPAPAAAASPDGGRLP